MTPIKTPDGLIEGFQHPKPGKPGRTLVQMFIKDAGMGNVLFELAAGYGIAKRLGMHFRWSWEPSGLRDFGLKPFGFAETSYPDVTVVARKLGQGNIKLVRTCEERIRKSDEKMVGISCPFQDEACFADVADEIRELFKLVPLPLDIPEGKTPVAVQVRRGDYVNHQRLNVTTPEYFHNAIDFIRQRIAHPQFFIVSDDPEWCQQHFGHLPDVTVMPPQDPIDGLRTMVACEAHIVSNSTFGWWGAWLVDKLVVVPEFWHHRPGSYGDWKPAPDRWHRVALGRPVQQRPVVSKPAPPQHFKPMPREYERAIVIPWHCEQDKWQSLRFCLRSIHQYFEDRKCPIVILGTKRPGWLLFKSGRVRFEEVWSYQDALMRGVQIADEVAWWNDDIKLLKPTGWGDLRRPLHFGEVTPEFLADFEANPNPWRDAFRKVVSALAEEGRTVIRNYSVHVPYLYKLEEAVEILKRFGVSHKLPLETIYYNTYAGDTAKPLNGERATQLPFGDARYLNYTDHRLDPPLKEAIVARFPEYAPWELKSRFES